MFPITQGWVLLRPLCLCLPYSQGLLSLPELPPRVWLTAASCLPSPGLTTASPDRCTAAAVPALPGEMPHLPVCCPGLSKSHGTCPFSSASSSPASDPSVHSSPGYRSFLRVPVLESQQPALLGQGCTPVFVPHQGPHRSFPRECAS